MSAKNKIFRLIENISKREIFRNIIKLTFGSTISQIIVLAAYPFLSRIYNQEDFGYYSLVLSIGIFLSAFSTLSFEQALITADDENCEKLNALILYSSLIIFALALFLFNISVRFINATLNIKGDFYFFATCCLFGFFYALHLQLTNMLNKRKLYEELSAFRVIQSLSFVVLAFLANKFDIGYGLGAAFLCSYVFSDFYAYYKLRKKTGFKFRFYSSWDIKKAFEKFKAFPFYQFPSTILNNVKESGSSIFISWLFGPAILGYYAFSLKVLRMPINFIGVSISQALFKRFDELKKANIDLKSSLIKTLIALLAISFPFFLTLFIFGDKMFVIIFGQKWESAGRYSQIFAPWLYLNFVASILSFIPIVANTQKKFFLISAIYNFSFPAILIAGSKLFKSPDISFAALSIFSFLYMIVTIRFYVNSVNKTKVTKDK